MEDPRRIKVPWYSWRWRLCLLLPTLLFAFLAWNSIHEIRTEPIAGKFTHGHFSDFDSKSPEEAEENVVESVIEFLERLFADQVVLWSSQRGGGW